MSSPITLDLPEDLREYAETVARSTNRTVENVIVSSLRTVLGGLGNIDPADLAEMQDEALWGILHQPLAWAVDARLRELREKASLTPEEDAEIIQLVDRYDEWVLLRSEAILLLKNRGYEIPAALRAKK